MDEQSLDQRLSQLNTSWTLLAQAHGGAPNIEHQAQTALIQRYQKPVYRYLLGMLRNPDAADEVFQEFALRMVRGDFHKADASKGKFRRYVKTSLIHLVHEYRQRQARRATHDLDNAEEVAESLAHEAASDQEFTANWRKTLLERAWEILDSQDRADSPPYALALRLRTEKPDLSNGALVAELNNRLPGDRAVTEVALRKILQRARESFTEALLDEIAHSMQTHSLDDLEQEVIDLGLQVYCAKAIEKRRSGG
jgi:RNA polymerase sigma-70 factor (ECF subfamily)